MEGHAHHRMVGALRIPGILPGLPVGKPVIVGGPEGQHSAGGVMPCGLDEGSEVGESNRPDRQAGA